MKHKLFLISVLSLFLVALCSCKEERVTCKIITPENEDVFWTFQDIPVTVEASTSKGSIIQVEIFVDDKVIESLTEPPYKFTIPARAVDTGTHYLTAAAFSSTNQEVDNIFIIIK